MTSLSHQISSRPWHWWLLLLTVVFVGFLPSIGSSPVIWQDEVQIVDYGRVRLDPGTDWAVTWSTQNHRALQSVSYLGCIAAEVAYRLTGTVLGSRALCIAGGFLLASLALGMATQQQRGPAILGVLFAGWVLLDPALVDSYRSGRLDALAMAFVLGGAFCLQRHARTLDWRWLVAAAIALACAPYIWIRAAMAIPAALLPLVFANGLPTRNLLRTLLATVALTAFFGALLLPPAWQGLQELRALADSPVKEFRALAGSHDLPGSSVVVMRMLEDISACFLPNAPLLLLAALGLAVTFLNKELSALQKGLLAMVVLASFLFQFRLTTGLNHYPALYLLPMLVLLAWQGLQSLITSGKRVAWITAGLIVLLTAHFGYNVVDRSYNAWLDRATMGPDARQPVIKALPPAPRRLIVDDFRLYFLLRQAGHYPFYLFTDLDHKQHEFRFYYPPGAGDFLPNYLFTRLNKARSEETYSPEATPALLVGGNTLMWSAAFETQLSRSSVKQLPQGYRLVTPGSK